MGIDVIGIGALNFDYICDLPRTKAEGRISLTEAGAEDLGISADDLADQIRAHALNSPTLRTRFGGSAYLAVKTVSVADLGLTTGFIGVCPGPGEVEERSGYGPDFLTGELSHLADQDWIFSSDQPPGRALIHTSRGKRQWIGVAPGANDDLGERLRAADDESAQLVKYLATARWIHVSSLSSFDDFQFVMQALGRAKDENPRLVVSVDPGYEYTRRYSTRLREVLTPADFLFLNENEFKNLRGGGAFSLKSRIDKVRELAGAPTQVLIVKTPNRHQLIQILDHGGQGALLRTYWHHRLLPWQIEDDTGAGDVFAGAFIASALSPRLVSQQPGAIRIGAAAAAAKLRSDGFPTRELAETIHAELEAGMRREFRNRRGRMKLWARRVLPYGVSFALGVAATLLTRVLLG